MHFPFFSFLFHPSLVLFYFYFDNWTDNQQKNFSSFFFGGVLVYAENALASYDFEPEIFENDSNSDIEKRMFEIEFKISKLDGDDAASVVSDSKKCFGL